MLPVFRNYTPYQEGCHKGVKQYISGEKAQNVPVEVVPTYTEKGVEFCASEQTGQECECSVTERPYERNQQKDPRWH